MVEARAEIDEASGWYDTRQAGLGDEFLTAVESALLAVEKDPHRFEKLRTPRSRRDVRRCNLSRFPFSIVFECQKDEIVVVAIAHASRRPGYWRPRMA